MEFPNNNLNTLNTPSATYNIDQILKATQSSTKGGGFRKVLGGIVGGLGNLVMPGISGIIGNAISGSAGINPGGLFGDTMQYLQLQQAMAQEQEAFEAASSVLKSRHDASMSAIRNIN